MSRGQAVHSRWTGRENAKQKNKSRLAPAFGSHAQVRVAGSVRLRDDQHQHLDHHIVVSGNADGVFTLRLVVSRGLLP